MGGDGGRLDGGAAVHFDRGAAVAVAGSRPRQRAARRLHLPHPRHETEALLFDQKATR